MENIVLNFNYLGQEIKMQCKKSEYINNILMRYTNKVNKDINNIFFIYNGTIITNKNIKLEEINN